MDCTDLPEFEDEDESIEPCRACGIYFISTSTVIKPIFTKTGPVGDMLEIVQQMNAWNIKVERNDERPQLMCIACIGEFQKLLKFKRSCLETQEQFDELDSKRAQNGMVIKQEIDPENEEKFCGFIYLDMDDEEGIEEDGSRRVWAPLGIPHVPIKEEHTARVPQEPPVSSNLPEEATFAKVKPEDLAAANGFSSTMFPVSPEPAESQDCDDEIIRFTYEDDADDEALITLPPPIQEPGVFCKLCGHASLTQDQHAEHMSRIHMLKDCECHICGKKFVNAHESRLRFHMKWHKLQKHLKCPICGFFCNSKDTLKEHKLAVHTRSKCNFCGKTMKHKQLQGHLNRHIQENEEELALKLGLMQTVETPATTLPATTAPATTPPATTPPPTTAPATTPPCLIQCAFCEEIFGDAEELQTHVLHTHRTSPEEQPPEPELADETEPLQTSEAFTPAAQTETSNQTAVNASEASKMECASRHHSGINQRPNVSMCECNICGKTFNLQIKLNRHMKLHAKSLI